MRVVIMVGLLACAFAYAGLGGVPKQQVRKLALGKPVQVGTLTLVSIESSEPIAAGKYYTLAEASKLGIVEIVEMPGSSQVNSLEVRNRGGLPILLFSGELLLGGKQDRIVARDFMVPSYGRADVPVFCVEHGRWTGKPEFRSGDTFVPDSVRKAAYANSDQSMVWNEVAKANARVMASPSTGTIRGTLDSPEVKASTNKLLSGLNSKFKPTSKTVGVVCWLNGKIHSADIFANPKLFAASKSKLFKSYALDVQLASSPKTVPVDLAACKKFLADIQSAKRSAGELSANGNLYRLQDKRVTGYESGVGGFRGGVGGGAASTAVGYSHGSYSPGGGG